mmetsp:Transcript_54714/g.173762  ORF Transcript_54714/g.173762 Transcript_54714/m.173762 type:complete len:201 (-) Transcript_54714:222-824(-)
MKSGRPSSSSLTYSATSSMFQPPTSVRRYTVRCCFSRSRRRHSRKRSQKSLKMGRSMALRLSRVAPSTDTYSCVTGAICAMRSGNCALVTRKVDMRRPCSSPTSSLICGYMMGSPTRLSAQCRGSMPSASLSGRTPGTPFICLTILTCSLTAVSTIMSAGSISHFHSFPTGLVWWRQQNTHLLAHASEGVASMHRCDSMP